MYIYMYTVQSWTKKAQSEKKETARTAELYTFSCRRRSRWGRVASAAAAAAAASDEEKTRLV